MKDPRDGEERYKEIQQALRDLTHPAKLERSSWAASCLVAQKLQANPHLTAHQALKEVLSEALDLLAGEASLDADLLRGRYWEQLTVNDMVYAQRPLPQSERQFHIQQKQALQHFDILLRRQEERYRQKGAASALLRHLPCRDDDSDDG